MQPTAILSWSRPAKAELANLFARDPARSPFDKPMRALALVYVNGMKRHDGPLCVTATLIPGVGELFMIPALTISGPCDILFFEGIPGGPLDCFDASSRRRRPARARQGDDPPLHSLGSRSRRQHHRDRCQRHRWSAALLPRSGSGVGRCRQGACAGACRHDRACGPDRRPGRQQRHQGRQASISTRSWPRGERRSTRPG